MAVSASTYARHIWHIWYIWSVWYVANVRSWRALGKGFAVGRASSSKEGENGYPNKLPVQTGLWGCSGGAARIGECPRTVLV